MFFENVCASLGIEPDTLGVESNRFINSATLPFKKYQTDKGSHALFIMAFDGFK